jgi:cytochrome o ubiquinol oxidase operon protein cyoD
MNIGSKLNLRTYVSGYLLCVGLSVSAYLLVTSSSLSNSILVAAILALALVQFIVQLLFFLHLSHESKPRWRLLVFIVMVIIVLIIVIGSIWIMNGLNYNMNSQQIKNYLNNQGGGF